MSDATHFIEMYLCLNDTIQVFRDFTEPKVWSAFKSNLREALDSFKTNITSDSAPPRLVYIPSNDGASPQNVNSTKSSHKFRVKIPRTASKKRKIETVSNENDSTQNNNVNGRETEQKNKTPKKLPGGARKSPPLQVPGSVTQPTSSNPITNYNKSSFIIQSLNIENSKF